MRTPNKPLRTFTGAYDDIRLDFTPGPPLTEEERYRHRQNYPTTLAYVHVYLNGEDAAELLPSGYLLWILDNLLSGFADIATGRALTESSSWGSDPWQFDLRGDPAQNRIFITLHVPERWVAMHDVAVPLDRFGAELLHLAHRWERYLLSLYLDEIMDPAWGEDYRLFQRHVERAQHALHEYQARQSRVSAAGGGNAAPQQG